MLSKSVGCMDFASGRMGKRHRVHQEIVQGCIRLQEAVQRVCDMRAPPL